MPAISEKVIYRKKLKDKGSAGVFGVYTEAALIVTQDLLDTLKASRGVNKDGVDHNNTHYAPHQVEQIIELFTLDPEDEIEEGNGDFVQWQDKLIDMQTKITQIVTQKDISLEDAKVVVEASQALNRYFNNFTTPTESNPKYFRYIQTHVAYSHLYVRALAINALIEAYIQESEIVTETRSFATRQAEVGSFENFVTQFQQLQNTEEVTTTIHTQYGTYLGWIEKYFPAVLGKVAMLEKSYFNDLNSIQHTGLTNRVTAAYDDLKIAYNKLYPTPQQSNKKLP